MKKEKKQFANRPVEKQEVRARLTINGICEMDKKQLKSFRKWIIDVAEELTLFDPKEYSKVVRFTLYK